MMGGFGGGFGPGGLNLTGRTGTRLSMREKVALKSSPWVLLRRLGGLISEYRIQLLLSLACIIGESGLQMLMPWAFKHVIDVTIPRADTRELLLIGGGLVLMQIVRHILAYYEQYIIALVSQQLVYRMAKDLFERIQRLSLRFYERWGAGEIISRITNDIGVMQQAISGGTVRAAISIFNMVAFAIIMVLLNWQLAVLVYCTVPVMIVASTITASKLRVRYTRVQERVAEVNNVLQENIAGVRVSKAFAREGEQRRRFSDRNRGNLDANMSTAGVQAVATPAIQMISALGMALILGVGTWQITRGSLTVGALVAFISYLIQFYQPVEDLIRLNTTAQQALAASERIFEFIDEVPEVVERPDAIDLEKTNDETRRTNGADARGDSSSVLRPSSGGVRGRVTFERVTFAYEPGKPVLHDIDIDAEPGQIVALVGHTGSGKTTCVNLIPRFYDPDGGRVTLDGYDLRDLTLSSLRSQVSVVIQETFLFGTSLADNIRYGRLGATDEEVVAAARQSHADEFITQLPEGYRSWAGEGGVLLSRGQRQRIALARAIVKDPRILILDEATSDVDTETEVLIQRALESVMRGRTTFVIAHRLSTIRNADQIVVLDHGHIVEQGRHADLLAAGGHYANLYQAQFAGQEATQAKVDALSAVLS